MPEAGGAPAPTPLAAAAFAPAPVAPIKPAAPTTSETEGPSGARPVMPAAVGKRRPTAAPALAGWPVAALAAIAILAWSLASWSETVRAARDRRPERLALQPTATPQPARSIAP